MRRWTIYITLLVLLSAATHTYREIVWEKHTKLNWADFNQTPQNKHYAALTASGITFTYTTKATGYEAEVFAVFDKDESWVDTNLQTDALLDHERLHFDITELWTRKLRKAMLDGENTNAESLNNLYNLHLAGLSRMQAFYDEETHHSLNKTVQAEWVKGVAEELDKLHYYQESIIIKNKPLLAQQ